MTTITIDRTLLEQSIKAFNVLVASTDGSVTIGPYGVGLQIKAMKALQSALASPATAPEFPADWAQMIHYPECWDTAAYPELRDAIHEALAWSGCSVCKPATAPERKPMHEGEIQAAWLGQDLDEPIPYSFVLGIRSAERFNGIKETP
jgi:hypothetical protein